jgi:Rps23 Pro-64 3,4-dihydroxylase Tpa1-like proline 4-hydroxylase
MIELSNPALDRAAIRQALRTDGFVQIDNYLPAASATRLHLCLDKEVVWDLAYSEQSQGRLIKAGELARMTPAEIRKTVDPAFAPAPDGFRFIYNTFRVIEAWQVGDQPGHPLYALADAMHTPTHLQALREMTGYDSIARMDLMAARYLPGHFLTPHDDSHEHEGREVAYILNLTHDWQPEWGGLLHLMDDSRQRITHSLIPRYNSMVLFRPPRWHFVSQVANFARKPRYTLTGWMLNT